MTEQINPINARIREIIADSELTIGEFSEKIGVSRSTLKTSFSRAANPGLEVIIGIANEYSQYNLEWLILGRGDKLKESYVRRVYIDADDNIVNELPDKAYNSPVTGRDEDVKKLQKQILDLLDSCHTLVKTNSQLVEINANLQLNSERNNL